VATGGVAHTWISAVYMSVITVTTVGFGDFTPKSHIGRIFGIFWMTLGVAATGVFLERMSSVLAPDSGEGGAGVAVTSEDVFQRVDKDGKGFLTKAEYTRYILARQGYLPLEVLQQIDDAYERMDVGASGHARGVGRPIGRRLISGTWWWVAR